MPTEFRADASKDPNLFGFFGHGKYRTVKKSRQVFVEWYDKNGKTFLIEWDDYMKTLLDALRTGKQNRGELLESCSKDGKLHEPLFSRYLKRAEKRGVVRGYMDMRERIYELTDTGQEFVGDMLAPSYVPTLRQKNRLEKLKNRLGKVSAGTLLFDDGGKVWLLDSEGERIIGTLYQAEKYVEQLQIKAKHKQSYEQF